MQKIDVSCTNGVTVAAFGPDPDVLGTTAIEEMRRVQKSVEENDPPRLVINLQSASDIDAAFLNYLLELNQRLRFQIDGKLGISNLPEQFRHDLSVMNVDSSLEMFESCEEAIAAFSVES